MRKKRNDKRFNGEMIRYLMAALGGIKRHRYVEMSPVAKLGHPYGLLFRAYQSPSYHIRVPVDQISSVPSKQHT